MEMYVWLQPNPQNRTRTNELNSEIFGVNSKSRRMEKEEKNKE